MVSSARLKAATALAENVSRKPHSQRTADPGPVLAFPLPFSSYLRYSPRAPLLAFINHSRQASSEKDPSSKLGASPSCAAISVSASPQIIIPSDSPEPRHLPCPAQQMQGARPLKRPTNGAGLRACTKGGAPLRRVGHVGFERQNVTTFGPPAASANETAAIARTPTVRMIFPRKLGSAHGLSGSRLTCCCNQLRPCKLGNLGSNQPCRLTSGESPVTAS